MERVAPTIVALLALASCGAERNEPMGRDAALGVVEQSCLRVALRPRTDPRATPADPNPEATCACVRDRIGRQISDDGELEIIAALERIAADMAAMDGDDFQAAERLRRQYNATLDRLADRSRGRAVSMASQEARAACRVTGSTSEPAH